MILRKPYAFLIKHFKLLHIILTILISYSVYKTNLIIHFFNEYISSSDVIIGSAVRVSLFNGLVFFVPFLVVIFSIILLAVMYNKKKPFLFYILVILVNIISIAIYGIAYSNVLVMQNTLINVRTASLIRDFLYIELIMQTVIVIISTIRATGFDIKKFNFVKDLQDLEIDIKDREEFEVDVSFDTNRFNRHLRRGYRYIKYVYIENQFLIHLSLSLICATVCFIIYFNLTIYQKTYNQQSAFSTNSFIMHVENTYVTNTDYQNKKLNDNYLVVVEVALKTNYGVKEFDVESLDLKINDQHFKHTIKYKDKMFDLGNTYINQEINNKFSNYTFTFEIPSSLINEPMTLRYINEIDYLGKNLQPKYVRVKLEPKDLKTVKKQDQTLQNVFSLNDSSFKDASVRIDSYEIQDKYKLEYSFCAKKDVCYTSYEYIVPSSLNNYEKTLLKLTGSFELNNNAIKNIYNLYDLIEYFGVLEYTINDEAKTRDIAFKRANSTKDTNTYYIEVLKEVKNATKIDLKIVLRNYEYIYHLK